MERLEITEESNIHEIWYKDADKMTMEELPEFLRHLTEDYTHDYGTICHAMTAAAIATIWAMNKTSQGGITGFQAGAIMWEFIRNWNYKTNKCGLKLVDYDHMLYPQYEEHFSKTISSDTWEAMQKDAADNLEKSSELASEGVVKHWQSIVDGNIPFGYTIRD